MKDDVIVQVQIDKKKCANDEHDEWGNSSERRKEWQKNILEIKLKKKKNCTLFPVQ